MDKLPEIPKLKKVEALPVVPLNKQLILCKGSPLELTINVPSIDRAQCYQADLEALLNELFRRLHNQFPHVALTKELTQMLLEHHAELLDKQIQRYLSRDLATYRATNSIKLNSMTKEVALEQYKQYLQAKSEGQTFSQYLRARYPLITELNNILCTNFATNTQLIFQRIERDFDFICNAFLSDLGKNIKLNKISLTGSDLHKQGQQVAILEFIDDEGKKKKIIYKPSPVQADAMLVGNVELLKKFDTDYKNCFSLIEGMNRGLGEQALPTYLIAPRQDPGNNDLINHYGYIEFLEHEPWHDINFEDLVENFMRNTEPSQRPTSRAVQNEIKNRYIQFLKEASKRETCDFITRDKRELDRYSFECGILLALMTCTGMGDAHCENLILHQRRPMLIDCEVCFAFMAASIENTECLSPDAGCMNRFSLIPQVHSCLIDINGMIEKTIYHMEKNRFFHLYFQQGDKLISYQPDINILIEGYARGLEILSKTDVVKKWLEQSQIQGMLIRILPAGTSEFRKFLEAAFDYNFDQNEYKSRSQNKFEKELSRYIHAFEEYRLKSHSGIAQLMNVPPLPNYVVFDATNPITNHLKEFQTYSIPVFYAYANGQRLYNYNGQEIRVPTGDHLAPFFSVRPIDFIISRINCIIDNEDAYKELTNRARRDYEANLANIPPSLEERLVEINLAQDVHLVPISSKDSEAASSSDDTKERKDRGCHGCNVS